MPSSPSPPTDVAPLQRSAAPRPRRGWLFGVGLAVAAPLVGAQLMERQVARLEAALTRQTGAACTIDAVEAGLTGTLRVRGVRVGELLSAEAIEASVGWGALGAGAPRVEQLRVEGPRIAISVDADGESDLERMLARWASRRARRPAGSRARAAAPRRIVVSEGELLISIAGVGTLRAHGVELTPDPAGVRAVASRVQLRAALGAHAGRPIGLNLELGRAAADVSLPRLAVRRLVAVGGRGTVELGGQVVELDAVAAARLGSAAPLTAQLTVRDHGVPRPLQLWANLQPIPTVLLRATRAPLWPIASLVPGWLTTNDAWWSGQLAVSRGASLGVAAAGHLEGILVRHPVLASTAVELSSEVDLVATWSRPPSELAPGTTARPSGGGWLSPAPFDVSVAGTVALGGASWSGTAVAHHGAALSAALDVSMQRAPCADLLAAIPSAMRGPLDGMALTGELGGHLRVTVDTAAALGDGAEIHIGATGGCAAAAEPPGADVSSLLRPREHVFPDGRRATIGPGVGAWVELRQLPAHVEGAFVSAEDARFFAHGGFDVAQIARSLEIDLREERLARGGSTISQQLIKNSFLDGKRSAARKLTEAILTWRLEERLAKRDILERYLNIIELGPSIYGLAEAAQHWFGVSPRELTVRQAAFLAALTPEPTTMTRRILAAGGLDHASEARLDTVLRAMRRGGVLSAPAYELARRAQLTFRPAALRRPPSAK
ncbi:MAG: biosynthetic peptidoglycan transglycosylase [Kofleriaceae bacterium]